MSQAKCPKCGVGIVPYEVGFPHERVCAKVCTNCIKLKLSNQIQHLKDF